MTEFLANVVMVIHNALAIFLIFGYPLALTRYTFNTWWSILSFLTIIGNIAWHWECPLFLLENWLRKCDGIYEDRITHILTWVEQWSHLPSWTYIPLTTITAVPVLIRFFRRRWHDGRLLPYRRPFIFMLDSNS